MGVTENFSITPILREIYHLLSTACLHTNWDAYVACNFNCCIETKGRLNVTAILHRV